jgi:hypothetical protein
MKRLNHMRIDTLMQLSLFQLHLSNQGYPYVVRRLLHAWVSFTATRKFNHAVQEALNV